MEPFNIRIHHNEEEVTLTILPEKNYYKLIYFGGIIGAIKEYDGGWELLQEADIEAGGLPFYAYKSGTTNESKFELSLPKINQIAAQIENAIY